MQGITHDEYQSRLRRVREALAAARLDALVAYANKTHPGHVRYLSGYEPRLGIHDSAVCVVTPERCTLLTNASFDRPTKRTWMKEVVVTSDYAAAIADVIPNDARCIGVAGFRALPAPVYIGLREQFMNAQIEDASELLLALRQIKTPAEIDLLREASRITDAGGRAFLEWARPGISERELQAQVEAALKRALDIYEEYQITSDHAGTLNNLANVYLKQAKYAEAEASYRQVLEQGLESVPIDEF